MVHRWGGGWPSILLLGAAYGAIEEGLLEPTWFTPQLQAHPYGVALGVFWTYAVFNIGYHAVFSIAIPILLTELIVPRLARQGPGWAGRDSPFVGGGVRGQRRRHRPAVVHRTCRRASSVCRPGCTRPSRPQPPPWSSP